MPTKRRPIRTAVLVLAATTALAAVGVGVYGLIIDSRNPHTQPSAATEAASPSSATMPTSGTPTTTSTATTFALQVARALYDWDTTTDTPGLVRDRLLDMANTDSDDINGLAADIAAQLPDSHIWDNLAQHHTTQRLDVVSAQVPDTWAGAAASAAPGELPPGVAAITITGVRHRQGVVNSRNETTERPAALTVFLACDPDQCRLLRLSAPDRPLP